MQRGAVPALVRMLGMPDVSLKEMAAFALGRLAQNVDNQVRRVRAGRALPHSLSPGRERHALNA